MPFSAEDVAAHAATLAREPQMPERIPGIDIIARLEADPRLTLDDILAEERSPVAVPTLTGRENAPIEPPAIPDTVQAIGRDPAGALQAALSGVADPLGVLPTPPARVERRPVATLTGNETLGANQVVPRWGGAEDQSAARLVGSVAGLGPAFRAGGEVVRGARTVADPVARAVAAHPVGSTVGLAGPALVAAPARTQTPDARAAAESAQHTLNRFTTERQQLLTRQEELTNLSKRFENISTTDTARIRQLQEFLALEGLYGIRPDGTVVTPDGRWGEGTRIAIQRYLDRNRDQLREVSTQISQLTPSIENAQKALQAAQRAAAVEAGSERMREIENEASPWQKALRGYGPAMGYALGLLGIGPAIRWGVTRYQGEGAARAADALMAETRRDVPGRVGRVNDFWTRGQSPMFGRRQAPFTRDAAAPTGYAANTRAPEASALFQPNRTREQLENAAVAGFGVGDMALAQFWLLPKAEAEERAAREELSANPNNETAIRRLQAALDLKATFQTLGNVGIPSIAGYAGASHFMPRGHVRPNVGAAEAERVRLDRLLHRDTPAPTAAAPTATPRTRPAPGSAPPEGSIWNEAAQRWMGPAEPGRPGRSFLSGDYAPPRGRRRSE